MQTLQNDRLNPSFVKDINVVGKEMTRNGRKMCITIVTTRLGESVFTRYEIAYHVYFFYYLYLDNIHLLEVGYLKTQTFFL